VRVSLKSISGVDSVEISLEKGLAVVKMKPGNTVTFKQLNDAIAKNGFTMKDSTATIAGTVVTTGDKATLRVSGSNDVLQLLPQSDTAPTSSVVGQTVVVEGTIPESVKGKTPDTIRYRSIAEERSQ
jgi:copper chaperone CopZ